MSMAKIASKRCATCIFGPDSPVGADRMRELHASWAEGKTHQICHAFGVGCGNDDETGEHILDGEDVWCRGFYETQTPPEVRAFVEELARFGGVEFVDPEDAGLRKSMLEKEEP